MDYFNRLSLSALTAIAGLCGTVLGLLIHAEINTARQRVAYLLGGNCCSILFTPVAAEWLAIEPEKMPIWLPAIGFTLGLFGMALLQRIKMTVDNLDIGAIIAARFRDVVAAIRGQK